MNHSQKVRHTIARLTEIHTEGLRLTAELAFLLGGTDKADLGTLLAPAKVKAAAKEAAAAAPAPVANPVRLTKVSSIEAAPKAPRFRRTEEELAEGLTVEQCIERRAALVAQGLPPIKSARVRPAAQAAVAPVVQSPASKQAKNEVAAKAVLPAPKATRPARAPKAAVPPTAPSKSRRAKVASGAGPVLPNGLFGEMLGGAGPNIAPVTPSVDGFSG